MPVMKHSRQRDAILTYLNNRTDHPTAEMIFSALQTTMPNISLGTIYRNLSQLVDCGMILKISCDGTADHFDATTHPHPHFFCNCCGNVSDFPGSLPLELFRMTSPEFKGKISGCSIMYYGVCETCLQDIPSESNLACGNKKDALSYES